jgi:hypothetical protein
MMTESTMAYDDAGQDARDGDGTMSEPRLTSLQVDNMLISLAAKPSGTTGTIITDMAIEALCRDWLDMQDAEARQRENDRLGLLAVIEGAELRRRLEAAVELLGQLYRGEIAAALHDRETDQWDVIFHGPWVLAVEELLAFTRPTPDQEG